MGSTRELEKVLLQVINREKQTDLYYLHSNIKRRKNINATYSEILNAVDKLKIKAMIKHVHLAIYEITEKGGAYAENSSK